MSALDELGVITPGYEHVSKVVHPAPLVEAGGGVLKWYDIAEGDKPIPRDIAALAREGLAEATAGDALAGELGIRDPAPLWRGLLLPPDLDLAQPQRALGDRLGEAGAGHAAFEPWPVDTAHHPTFCVWELRAVCHEQGAWSRYLRSSRDAVAKKEYLKDTYTGLA